MIKRLRPYAGSILLDVLAVLCNVGTMLFLPKYMAEIINRGVLTGDIPYILSVGLKMLLVTVVGASAMIGASYLSAKVSMGLGRTLRSEVFVKAEGFSLAEFDRFGTASLITRTTNDITQIETFFMMLLRIAIMAPLALVGGITMAFTSSPEMSRVVFFSIPALLVVIICIARVTMPLSKKMQRLIDRVNQVMREKLTGLRVLRAFGTEAYEEERFDEANTELTGAAVKMNRLMTLMLPALMFVLNFSTIGIIWLGVEEVASSALQVGDIMAMVQYVMQIMMSFMMLSMIFVIYPRAAASAERITEVLSVSPAITDPAQPQSAGGVRGRVEFDNVTFSYQGAESPALEQVSFQVGPGQTLAIIGSTGSGKSTILNLIPRFYDVTNGRVLVDGVDVRQMGQRELRRKIGYVPQKAVLFRGSIADNVGYGAPGAGSKELEEAAEIAQAADFIAEKPEGFDSAVTRGGGNLSGGQKQRLSIARAIAREPEIYLFDDSFSALDYATDAKLRAALAGKTREAAVIIVAQRVSTIMNADAILVLDHGRVAGIGPHKELLKSCEVYREIVTSQFSDEEVGA